jgi:hypothetical protein
LNYFEPFVQDKSFPKGFRFCILFVVLEKPILNKWLKMDLPLKNITGLLFNIKKIYFFKKLVTFYDGFIQFPLCTGRAISNRLGVAAL